MIFQHMLFLKGAFYSKKTQWLQQAACTEEANGAKGKGKILGERRKIEAVLGFQVYQLDLPQEQNQ